MRTSLSILLAVVALPAMATELPPLNSPTEARSYSTFISSESSSQGFDSWVIDSGYEYSVFDDIDLFIGARLNSGDKQPSGGFLSGISYQLNDRLSFKSALRTPVRANENDRKNESIAAEITSRLKLSDNLDLHATLDYQEWQQGVELGLFGVPFLTQR